MRESYERAGKYTSYKFVIFCGDHGYWDGAVIKLLVMDFISNILRNTGYVYVVIPFVCLCCERRRGGCEASVDRFCICIWLRVLWWQMNRGFQLMLFCCDNELIKFNFISAGIWYLHFTIFYFSFKVAIYTIQYNLINPKRNLVKGKWKTKTGNRHTLTNINNNNQTNTLLVQLFSCVEGSYSDP